MNLHRLIARFTMLICIYFFLACNSTTKKNDVSNSHNDTESVLKDSLSSNKQWQQAINTKDLETLKAIYHEAIYGLSTNGIDFSHRDTLMSIVANNDFVVKGVKTIKRIEANSKYDYEIGSFKNKKGDLMKHLIIWDTSPVEEKRVVEFLTETSTVSADLKEIDAQRATWKTLCNAHNAENLINSLYTPNTMYYNHKPLVVGREHLIPIYSYMNNKDYQLTLDPIHVEPVSNLIVFEIGQCHGSYNGKYILIWQKTEEGWQILFDSNI